MAAAGDDSQRCAVCARPLPSDPVETEGGHLCCCAGCRDVFETVGGPALEEARPKRTSHRLSGESGQGHDRATEGVSEAFLTIDGLGTYTGERFLETVATSCEGVVEAEASYVTETIRIAYRPDIVAPSDLSDTLTVLGYRAYPRDEDLTALQSAAGSGQPTGHQQQRGLDDTLGFRYAAGVLFGAFLLLPYISLLYPAHLSAILDSGFLGQFDGGIAFDGPGGLLVVRLYVILTAVVLFFTGKPLLRGAYVSLKMRTPNADLLVSLTVVGAFVYSSLAAVLGRSDVYYDLTVVVAAGVVAAIFYETLVKRRALDRLRDMTFSQVDEATRYGEDGTTRTVPVSDLEPGDRLLVQRGDRVPVDGVLAEGRCTVDEAVVTGESLPVEKRAGDGVVGGSVVTGDAAVLRVGEGARSRIDDLVTSVWNIQSAEHGVQRRADELAGTIAPVVVTGAVLVAAGNLVLGGSLLPSAMLGLLVTLTLCPWGLGLATPLSVATSIDAAVDRGIVIFDETVFERLRDIDVVVFDKTGTLTTGRMDVLEADAPDELLRATAALERRAAHPVADAIVSAFGETTSDSRQARADGGVSGEDGADGDREPADVRDFESYANGIKGVVDGADVLVGNLDCFADRGWAVSDDIVDRVEDVHGVGQLPVVVGRDGQAVGLVVVGDEPRDGWRETVERLGDSGTDIVVLTGDDAAATAAFGDHSQVDHVFAGVPPEGKTAAIAGLRADRNVAMVGDGTNDAPAIALADLGITLGSGTAVASDAADIAIADDDLRAVETAFDLASAAGRRVRENAALALVFNVIAVPLVVLGLLNPLTAMLAVVATAGLITANASRRLVTTE